MFLSTNRCCLSFVLNSVGAAPPGSAYAIVIVSPSFLMMPVASESFGDVLFILMTHGVLLMSSVYVAADVPESQILRHDRHRARFDLREIENVRDQVE